MRVKISLFCHAMHQISIIIITYNRPEDTLELLQGISRLNQQEELLHEVVLLNNASTVSYDAVKEFIAVKGAEKWKWLDAAENLGVSRGRNHAAKLATGDILFFLDDDIVIEDPDILPAIVQAFNRRTENKRKIGVISTKVRYTINREIQVNAFPHKKFTVYKDLPWFLTGYYVGCSHAFLRECWLKAGNYPEDFFYGMEEYDESYRVIEAGYAIGYDASVEVFHKESPLGRTPKAEKLRMMWVNKAVVAWRYLPIPYFFSTCIGWSLFFLRNSKFNLTGFLRGWFQACKIPFAIKRQPISKESRQYLQDVQARLWF